MVLSKVKIKSVEMEGDFKIIKRFAWLPKRVQGFMIWLEYYKEVYEYKVHDRHTYSIACKRWWYFKNCGGWDLIAIQRIP